jgi:hypothetical protein
MLYSEHVRKERKAYNAYNKKVLKAAALGKKVNLREVQPVKLFSQLTAAEKLVFEQRAAEEIPYGYFVIGKCTRVETTNSNLSRASSVERGSSRKSKLVTTAGLNLTRIKPGDTPAILTIFFAKQPSLQDAQQQEELFPGVGDKQVLEVSWKCLLTNSWFMSEHDVAVSECRRPQRLRCCRLDCKTNWDAEEKKEVEGEAKEEEATKKEKPALSWCDGAVFPGRGPTVFPCDRLFICLECREGQCYREEKTDIWHCDECLLTPRTFEGLYGYITPPRDNPRCNSVSFPVRDPVTGTRTQGRLPVRSPGAPVLRFGTNHNPAKAYIQFLQRREAAKKLSYVEQRQKEGAAALLDIFNDAGLSAGQVSCVVNGLKKMKERNLIQTPIPIFAKLETLKKRTGRGEGDVFASIPETHFIDTSALGQGETEVAVNLLDPLLTFQRLLLKPSIPVSAMYIGDGEVLAFEDGEPAVGGEYCQNEFYRSRCKDFPKANTKVLVIVSSDNMIASGQTSCPLYIRNGK